MEQHPAAAASEGDASTRSCQGIRMPDFSLPGTSKSLYFPLAQEPRDSIEGDVYSLADS
jgi:hypothetical protein